MIIPAISPVCFFFCDFSGWVPEFCPSPIGEMEVGVGVGVWFGSGVRPVAGLGTESGFKPGLRLEPGSASGSELDDGFVGWLDTRFEERPGAGFNAVAGAGVGCGAIGMLTRVGSSFMGW